MKDRMLSALISTLTGLLALLANHVDSRPSSAGWRLTRDVLQTLPTARDPWALLELAPGVMVDRVNVGGSESGRQADFWGRGSDVGDNQWNVDGVTVTDPAAVGHSPIYYDFDAFEEVEVSTGAGDVEAFTGGVTLRIVTRRPDDRWMGGGRFYWTGQGLSSDNVRCVERAGGVCMRFTTRGGEELWSPRARGNQVDDLRDLGINVGGPLLKGRLWSWGAYGGQWIGLLSPTPLLSPEQVVYLPTYDPHVQAQRDRIQLYTVHGKLNAQVGHHRLEGLLIWSNKTQSGQGASGTRPPETTWTQTGPVPVVKLQDDLSVSERLSLSVRGAFIGAGFRLDPGGGRDTFVWQDEAGVWHQSYFYYRTSRPTWQLNGQAVYSKSQFLGGRHEIKVGAEFRRAHITSQTGWGNGEVYLRRPTFNDPNRYYAIFVLPGRADYWKQRVSGYVQDTYAVGRWTMELGIRWDLQSAGYDDVTVEAPSARVAQFLAPRLGVTGGRRLMTWTTVSPRVGLSYDVTGTGQVTLRSHLALYPSELSPEAIRQVGTTYREVLYLTSDMDGDYRWTPGEPLLGPLLFCGLLLAGECDENLQSLDRVGDVRAPRTLEWTAGVEYRPTHDWRLGLTLTYRRLSRFPWWLPQIAEGDIYDCWVPIGRVEDLIPEARIEGDSALYTCDGTPTAFIYSTRPDYWQDSKGIELRFIKELDTRWMLLGALTLQDWRQHFDSRRAYLDPTNARQLQDAAAAPTVDDGKTEIWPNTRWMVQLGGIVRLPFDARLGVTLLAREGYILANAYRFDTLADFGVCNAFDCGEKAVLRTRFGDERLPALWLLNVHLEKAFSLRRWGRVILSVDGFNVTNNATALGRYRFVNLAGFGKVTEVVAPRVFRVGVRYEY